MISKIVRQARNSTKYSIDGLSYLLGSEFAARIEVYAFAWLFAGLLLLRVPIAYLVNTVILFLVLLAVEALNTAVEVIIDRVSPEISPMGKQAKDLGSFSVMCLLICNILHLGFVLTRIDWQNLDERLATPGTLSFISLILLCVGIYALTASRARPFGKWIMGALSGLCLAGLIWSVGEETLFAASLGLLAGLAVGIVAFDLIGQRRWTVSQALGKFIHRRVRIGREDLTEETRAAAGAARIERPGRSAALATLAIMAALALHPVIRPVWM